MEKIIQMRIITHTIRTTSDLVFSLISYSEGLSGHNGCCKVNNDGPVDDLEIGKF